MVSASRPSFSATERVKVSANRPKLLCHRAVTKHANKAQTVLLNTWQQTALRVRS